MVARGDLGAELPVEEVPLLQVRLKNNIYNFMAARKIFSQLICLNCNQPSIKS
jgi:hypothetical protein